MPASTAKTHRPLILTATPHQLESKFLTQRDKPTLNARIKVRRKKHETPLELNVNVSNPFYEERRTSWVKDLKDQEGTGFTHNTPADTEMRGCIKDCMEKRHARVRAAKEEQQEGKGKRKKHLLGKKSRDFLKGVAIGSQGAAIGASVIPGAQPLAPAFEAASLASGALAGMGKPKKKSKKARYELQS